MEWRFIASGMSNVTVAQYLYTTSSATSLKWLVEVYIVQGLDKLNLLSPLGPEFAIRMLFYAWWRVTVGVVGFRYRIGIR